MGRPHTITGSVIAAHIIEAEVMLAQLRQHYANAPMSSNPVDYEKLIRNSFDLMDGVTLAIRNIADIVQANGEMEAVTSQPLVVIEGCRQRIEEAMNNRDMHS